MKGFLVLENGKVFEGERFGGTGDALGELVFNTNVVGYIEMLTDCAYAGQILLSTFPLCGNCGMIEADAPGDCLLGGFVVRELCGMPSNFRSDYVLERYFREKNIPVLSGIDTREVTRILRTEGTMNAAILSEVPKDLSFIASYRLPNSARELYSGEIREYPARGERLFNVTLIDCGAPESATADFTARGCRVTRAPFDSVPEAVLLTNPDGVVLSDGSGSPDGLPEALATVAALLGKVPVFGIGIGSSILAAALGMPCKKLKHGHRGGNQPVKDLFGTKTYITSQNHAYTCEVPSGGETAAAFLNLNDNTCEGFVNEGKKAMGVFFRPDTGAGPQDTSFIYDKFAALMGGNK